MKMIKVCRSNYESTTSIYIWINPDQIVSLEQETNFYGDKNWEALLTSGERVIIIRKKDLESLIKLTPSD